MTSKESIQRNLGLTFDFVTYLIDHPETIDTLPSKFRLEFVEQDFTKTVKRSDRVKRKSRLKSKYVKVRNTFEFAKR